MTVALITNVVNALYDHAHRKGLGVIGDEKWLQLKARLERGEWLRPSEVATLLDVGRTKVHEMLRGGDLKYRTKPASTHRVVNPASVRPLLPDVPQPPAEP
jgi:hypothetical protein